MPPRPVWVHLAFVFTLLFTALHVYWAVGGTWGLPPKALYMKAETQTANWVVSVIQLIGAAFILALNHPISRRVPSWMLLVPMWGGAVLCVSHAVYGFLTKGLYLAGYHGAVNFPEVPQLSAAEEAEKNHLAAVHDLLVFEPSFLLQGGLVAMAAWQFIRTPVGRRRWSMSLVVGTLVISVFGAVLSLNDLQFAFG